MKRLPSFNDFSPGIIGDLRIPLRLVQENAGDFDAIVAAWAQAFFKGEDNKRARTNIAATLGNIGLFDRKSASLTPEGRTILDAPTGKDAAARFVLHVINTRNGMLLVDAITSLNRRGDGVTKDSLKQALQRLGVEGLSSGTTDHTTLRNWMVEAGLLGIAPAFAPDNAALKSLLGVSADERTGLLALPLAQQIFLKILRRVSEAEEGHAVPTKLVLDECLRDYRVHFDEDQASAKVLRPLEVDGWIKLAKRSSKASGGKSGVVQAAEKLLSIPINQIVPDFDSVIPADLRAKIDTPRKEILRLLRSAEKYDRGLGLELLALRMLIDLGLQPRSFRQRSRDTAYAELDLTAEGVNLLFSRWNLQCKCVSARVGLADVAKEVGLAIYSKSHVVTMVTTSDFSREALAYAREISLATHLQFLFVTGTVVEAYLSNGPTSLLDYVAQNAIQVMATKRSQQISPMEENIPSG
jgi:hypothetical protein